MRKVKALIIATIALLVVLTPSGYRNAAASASCFLSITTAANPISSSIRVPEGVYCGARLNQHRRHVSTKAQTDTET